MCANIRIILDFRGCVRPAPPENRANLISPFRRAGTAPLFRPVPAISDPFCDCPRLRYLCSRKHRFRMNTVSKYLSLVKFAHTIFCHALSPPIGFVYAMRRCLPGRTTRRGGSRARCRSCSAWSSPAIRPWASTAGRPSHRRRKPPHRGREIPAGRDSGPGMPSASWRSMPCCSSPPLRRSTC